MEDYRTASQLQKYLHPHKYSFCSDRQPNWSISRNIVYNFNLMPRTKHTCEICERTLRSLEDFKLIVPDSDSATNASDTGCDTDAAEAEAKGRRSEGALRLSASVSLVEWLRSSISSSYRRAAERRSFRRELELAALRGGSFLSQSELLTKIIFSGQQKKI